MIRLSQKKLLSRLFQEKKSISNSKFKFPLLNNGYNKDDLIEATKVLLSKNLTMGKKQENLKNSLPKKLEQNIH